MEEGFFLFSYCILNHPTREEYSLHERLKLDKTVKINAQIEMFCTRNKEIFSQNRK